MSIYATQRNADNNQSTVDYLKQNIFTFGNRYASGVFINNIGESLDAEDGILVVRNAGSFETATVKFSALTAGQTTILAGLTYTSIGDTTAEQLAAAFADLAAGATTGAGTVTGVYSETLTDYSTGGVVIESLDTVVFTASTVGPKTNLADTGDGAGTTITIVKGTDGGNEGFSPATSATLANVIGILKTTNGLTTLANAGSMNANYCISGDIDAGMLILPNGVTLDSIVGSKALKDILTALGFVLNNVIEGTKYDN